MPSRYPIEPEPGRRRPVHGVRIELGSPTIVFVTVCAKDRQPWVAQARVQDSLKTIWREQATAWCVGEFLLMPDHVHFFCAPRDSRFTLERWVTFWKRCFTRKHVIELWVWQASFWDTRMRSARQYSEKWLYVQENPVRQGLVARIEDWPFKGKVHDLRA